MATQTRPFLRLVVFLYNGPSMAPFRRNVRRRDRRICRGRWRKRKCLKRRRRDLRHRGPHREQRIWRGQLHDTPPREARRALCGRDARKMERLLHHWHGSGNRWKREGDCIRVGLCRRLNNPSEGISCVTKPHLERRKVLLHGIP